MNGVTPDQFEQLLPLACEWAEQQECRILADGVPLNREQTADAVAAGVIQTGRVRMLCVDGIPVPEHPALRAEATRLISLLTAGLTVRYGIFIRSDCWGRRRLIVHELAHTAQYERLGGFQPFMERYLWECLTIGYPSAPIEQEAVAAEQSQSGLR